MQSDYFWSKDSKNTYLKDTSEKMRQFELLLNSVLDASYHWTETSVALSNTNTKIQNTNTNSQIPIHKYKHTITNTQIQIHKYKYNNTKTQIKIH